MSSTGYDIQKYNHCLMKAKKNSLTISTSGDKVCLFQKDNLTAGYFKNINNLFEFLCGYEAGYDKGKIEGINLVEQVAMEQAELDEFDSSEEHF